MKDGASWSILSAWRWLLFHMDPYRQSRHEEAVRRLRTRVDDFETRVLESRLRSFQSIFGGDFQGLPTEIHRLKEYLSSDDADLRANAIYAISCYCEPDEANARLFAEILERDADATVRASAIIAVSAWRRALGEPEALRMLIDVVFDEEEEPRVRETAYCELLDPTRMLHYHPHRDDFRVPQHVDLAYVESLRP